MVSCIGAALKNWIRLDPKIRDAWMEAMDRNDFSARQNIRPRLLNRFR